ncbi:MAG: acetate kinase [Candidatus Omnitrophota bacterium]
MRILVINCGSSSIKYKLFKMPQGILVSSGLIEKIGERGSKIINHHMGLEIILGQIKRIDAVGHRVVHGGQEFEKPTRINDYVIRKIEECSKLAPLHNPANIIGIRTCMKLLPGIPQIAVFDTAFYQTLPEEAFIYAIPYRYYRKYAIRKYGFHGTSHEYVAHEAAKRLSKPLHKLRLITCHLGNGCSITATKFGHAIDTSMGFTPLEGLVMGTRSGDIDPAVITFLMRKENISVSRIEEILNKESGLKGISGISNDLRDIMGKIKSNKRAKLALDIFVYRLKKYIGAYILAMGGLDAVIFTAGIGENQPEIRKMAIQGLSSLVKKAKILVIPTNEELMIARQTYRLMEGK